MLEVSRVASRRARDEFIKFPWRIYRDDPAWVPPLIIERRQFINRKRHPFYRHGDAELFLARRDGKVVGRIMASDDPHYNELHGTNVGCFGLFETVDDDTVSAALLGTAADWLRARGRTEIMGPIDYSTNYVCGLLVDGFEFPPTLLTSHNPPYYQRLIEADGFEKVKDFYAWWFDDPTDAANRLRRVVERRERRGKSRVTIREADLHHLLDEAARMRTIYNQAWRDNWGFVPFTEAEFDDMAREMKPILRSELGYMAEDAGKPVGFILALPDINVVLKKINGRLTKFGLPVGLAKLLYYKNRINRARLIALGVTGEYRRRGVAEALVLRIIEAGMIARGLFGELSMTLEDNTAVNGFLEAIAAKRYKTYRIFRRPITAQ